MDVGEVDEVTAGGCENLYLVETGMYDVTGYGCVYLVNSDRPAIVETGIGTNYEVILRALPDIGLAPEDIESIAVTHVHLDHAGGAGFLAEACPNADIFVHETGAPHLVDPEALVAGTKRAVGDQWRYYVKPRPVPEDRIRAITDGDRIDLGNHELVAKEAPGHAPHQVVYHLPEMDAVFTGDAAGIWVPERSVVRPTSPPPQFDLDQAVVDLRTIEALEPNVLLYTHFGPAATDGLLDAYEQTLAEWVAEVDAVSAECADEDAVVEHFVKKVNLDDVWGQEKAQNEMRLNVKGALTYLDRIRGEE